MKNKIKNILLILLGVHAFTYLLIGDIMLEHELLTDFNKFNQRRLASPYDVDKSEKFYFASCGDEFFRDIKYLNDYISRVNPNHYDPVENRDYYQWVGTLDKSHDIVDLLKKETKQEQDVTCIVFSVCRLYEVPMCYCKLTQDEIFSAHTDFHAMIYNEQYNMYEVHYVWFLFKWVKVLKTLEN